MATQYKTPGVYIQEPNSFPPSIVGVETAVPCFIGYTQFATDSDGRDLSFTPKRVESMAEFSQFYGKGYAEQYYLMPATDKDGKPTAVPATDQSWGRVSLDNRTSYLLVEVGNESFNLYNSMRLFYANGGGSCYIISVGRYLTDGKPNKIDADLLKQGLAACAGFIGPTMVLVPDALLLASQDQFDSVTQETLRTCAMAGDRMALLDVYGADELGPRDNWTAAVAAFRNGVSGVPSEMWRFGAAYFPPLVTSVVSPSEVDISSFGNIKDDKDKIDVLKAALGGALAASYPPDAPPKPAGPNATDAEKTAATAAATAATAAATDGGTSVALNPKGQEIRTKYVKLIGTSLLEAPSDNPSALTHRQLTSALNATVPGFEKLLTAVAATQGVLPASAAMAGVWATNDNLVGVWNAPANTGISTLIAPKLPINDKQQEDLNVPVEGRAVNAIRTFQGRGNLVWGARTLDSLSNDWRYIQVRRTMIYVEQSVKQALQAMVFKPNTAQTWVTVTSMIESFLHGLWAAGGLMGTSPGEAYRVSAGLGSTMTPDDVLNGVMRVQVVLQMVHPAEFIELTFRQQMLGGA